MKSHGQDTSLVDIVPSTLPFRPLRMETLRNLLLYILQNILHIPLSRPPRIRKQRITRNTIHHFQPFPNLLLLPLSFVNVPHVPLTRSMHGRRRLHDEVYIESIPLHHQFRTVVADQIIRLAPIEHLTQLLEEFGREANVKHVHMRKWIKIIRFGNIPMCKGALMPHFSSSSKLSPDSF